MTAAIHSSERGAAPLRHARGRPVSPGAARALVIVVIVGALTASFVASPAEAIRLAEMQAGADLVRLLRFMALLKGALALVAAAAVVWRLGVAVSPVWLIAYGAACGALAGGPVLIWAMVHVGTGALLLHGGLLAAAVLLWRDPQVARRLDALVAAGRVRRRT